MRDQVTFAGACSRTRMTRAIADLLVFDGDDFASLE